jgi:ABC-type dipeptide/oligopeptide/nickel transport system permease component
MTLFLFSMMEWLLPGSFGEDEWVSFSPHENKSHFLDIFWGYVRVLLLDSNLPSLSYIDKSVSQVVGEALQHSLKIVLLTLVFVILFLIGALRVAAIQDREIQQGWLRISDFVLSVPYLILVPIVVLSLPSYSQAGSFSWLPILVASILLSLRFGALSLQVFVNTKKRLEGESFVRTWFAIGGSEKNLVFFWLAPLIWAPWLQLLPSALVQLLTGNILVESLFRYPGLGLLFVESLQARDWPVLRFYLVWVSLLFFLIQMIVDYLMWTLDPRLRGDSE